MPAKKSSLSEKNTKSEILEAYQSLIDEISTTPTQLQQPSEKAIKEKTASETPDKIITDLASLKNQTNQTITQLETQLLDQTQRLQSLKTAIELAQKELEETHQLSHRAGLLQELIATHLRKQQELEEEIQNKKQEWEAEQKSYTDKLKTERTREQSEYDYQTKLSRRKADDEYEQEKQRRAREKDEYESKLKELEDLRKQVTTFPQTLQVEVDTALAKITAELKKEHEHEKAMHNQKANSEKELAQLKVQTLESTIKTLQSEISELRKRLDEATHHVKDIAVATVLGQQQKEQEHKRQEEPRASAVS
jgi:colicin import membrane protein